MHIRKFYANNLPTAMRDIRKALGADAVILSTRHLTTEDEMVVVNGGRAKVEVTAMPENLGESLPDGSGGEASLPAKRKPVKTELVRGDQEASVWVGCERELAAGRQAFVIYPVIEETEGQDLKAATVEHERLAAEVFPKYKVALLHGRMKGSEKDEIMSDFAAGRVQVLDHLRERSRLGELEVDLVRHSPKTNAQSLMVADEI